MLTRESPGTGNVAYDVPRLVAGLRRELRGAVADDRRTRALYAADGSNYRAVPDLVVVPADAEDLATAVALTAAAGAPVVVRGGGTSMAGNAIGGVVIDASRHVNRILEIDPEARTAVVEPGVVLTDLLAAAKPYGLAFGADPSSGSRATLGGMIANNACGAHSVAWGTTADNLRSLDVVLADGTRMTVDSTADRAECAARPRREGELHRALQAFVDRHELLIRRRFGQFTRQISGYALHRLLPEYGYNVAGLLTGSEGGLAATLRATVALTELPKAKVLCVLGFADSISSADCVPIVLRHGPLTMESINSDLVERLPREVRDAAVRAGLPEGNAWLLIEMGGEDEHSAATAAQTMLEDLRNSASPTTTSRGANASAGGSGIGIGIGSGIPSRSVGGSVSGIPGADGSGSGRVDVAGSSLAGGGRARWPTASLVTDAGAQAVLWRCRTDAAGLATRRADGAEAWGGWEDAAVPPERLGDYLRGLDELMGRHGLSGASYGHFGEGCMHMRIDFDLLSARGLATYREFVEQATDLVVELGGSVSGEHSDGRARGELLGRMYGVDGVRLFAELKEIWDPTRAMNPGMIVDPPPLDLAIRHDGPAKDRRLLTIFAYPDDDNDFAQAQRRCVGIGKCRQSSGGVMCPSYQVTKDELHSTRGRAHLLWEMLQGDVVTDGWRSTEVRDGLDLCLSCKGCLSDCPVNVDMATYKAEFTQHHYARRPWARPMSHWSMGWLPLWARLASPVPALANRFAGLGLVKKLGGIAAERAVPAFASETFTSWFAKRGGRLSTGGQQVVLWPDTFTNYLAPEIGRAAVEVLEAAGFEVVLPDKPVCCGLTWISTGQLKKARRVLNRSLKILEPHLAAGTPIVGLEPSCTAALRHDAPDLIADNPLADQAEKATRTFAELLAESEWEPPQVGGEALVQTHCHQHAALGFDADRRLMTAAGIDATIPDSGCCGLAGNFGFERDHYAVSKAIGERVLLPAVRSLPEATAVLADGFSCRTQITHGTTRHPHHLAELLAAALPQPTNS
ncbi:FAD-binding oxidoreductase [Kribbella capetownensis]|uniref:FAD-binding oxidoreductase n=1 Tax=Kribbella capetownensis TaxID=1572659 RepID=A0A4V2M856_9ACTN|nr:FAD-binding and (Fe-S)-binding domain-containing protein [Kribbella capetownensis]TCC50202.1 FAD-binding oxidoreductase [Kribbella capetownensis]